MKYSVNIGHDGDDERSLFSIEEYQCVTTPWRRLCSALNQCWQEHNSCLGDKHLYRQLHPQHLYDDYEESTRTALLSEHEQPHPDDTMWDKPNEPMFSDSSNTSSSSSSQPMMCKDGIFFMAPLSSPNCRSKTAVARKNGPNNWKIQRRMLLPANSFQRPIALTDDDDYDDFGSVKSLKMNGTRRKTLSQSNDHLWVDKFWPQAATCVQPRSASAFEKVLTVGSSSAVECLMIPPEPSQCSNQGDSCSSSLSSKEEFSYQETLYQSLSVNKAATLPSQTALADDDDDDQSSSQKGTSKLYPQSLTGGWQARSGNKTLAKAGAVSSTMTKTDQNTTCQDDRDDDESTGGSCYSIPTLTVSYEDDVAQLAVAFSRSLRDDEDSDDDEDCEEEPLVPHTMGLHCFTLGASFSHPAAAWNKPTQHLSLAPPPPLSPSSSVGSSSSMSDASQKSGRRIGISFPHPWYSSKLLSLRPKRGIPHQWPQQQKKIRSEPMPEDRCDNNYRQQLRPPEQSYYQSMNSERTLVEQRDEQDVWSMVESDPMDGDMTDPPTPVPIKTSKVLLPDTLGWSSSEEDAGYGFGGSSPPWRWPKTCVRPLVGSSSQSWEELPEEEEDGFIVRKPVKESKRLINGIARRLDENEFFTNPDAGNTTREMMARTTKKAIYSPRLAYPPFQPLFANS